MKLATLHDGSRDGQLVLVSRDLATAHFANGIATRMQQVLDDWNFISPQLEDLYATLNSGKARHAFAFDVRQCMAPLPRAAQWAWAASAAADASGPDPWADVDAPDEWADWAPEASALGAGPAAPAKLLANAEAQEETQRETQRETQKGATARKMSLLQGSSDAFLGAHASLAGRIKAGHALAARGESKLNFGLEAGLAAFGADVAQSSGTQTALDAVRLLGLVLVGVWQPVQETSEDEHSQPLGAVPGTWVLSELQAQAAVLFSPVVATPDELGPQWRGGRLSANLTLKRNGKALAKQLQGVGSRLHAGQLLAHLASTRPVRAGVVVGAMGLAGKFGGSTPQAAALQAGETVHLDYLDSSGQSVFGAIEPMLDAKPQPKLEPKLVNESEPTLAHD